MKLVPLVLLAIFTVSCQAAPKAESTSPNIIYILADDLGYGDLSCLNEKSKIKTASLDKLASEGIFFTDAHSGSSVCTPTRYGIVTGRYAWRSRLKKSVIGGASPHLINPDRMTVADLLKKQGYHTAMIGKWHLGWDFQFTGKSTGNGLGFNSKKNSIDYTKLVKNGPDANGFDYYYGHCGSLDMAPYVYVENGKVTALPDRETENKDSKGFWRKGPTGSDFKHIDVLPNCFNKANEYIEKRAKTGKPFFLYLPIPSPHTPILPIKEFQGKSKTNLYGDFVMQIDWHVGQLMKVLKKNNIDQNTIVIFTSDNGCSPRADFKELADVGHSPSHIYRGHKADIYEGGHRIPFIVHWPAKIKPNQISSETICLTDLMATAGDINNAVIPDNAAEDSVSFLPALLGQKMDKPLREATVHHSINGSFALRQGQWKLILCPGSGGWSSPRPKEAYKGKLPVIQLYNLNSDPGEKNNIYKENKEKVKELYSLLKKYVEEGRSTPGNKQSNEGKTVFNPKGFEAIAKELGL
jgi:arylsulfatase A